MSKNLSGIDVPLNFIFYPNKPVIDWRQKSVMLISVEAVCYVFPLNARFPECSSPQDNKDLDCNVLLSYSFEVPQMPIQHISSGHRVKRDFLLDIQIYAE